MRRLSPEQIDRAVELLRGGNNEYVSRGRSGDGFGHRDGVLYRVYVEDDDRQETPTTEAEFRAFLAAMDFDDYIDRYNIAAVQQLGIDIAGPTLGR